MAHINAPNLPQNLKIDLPAGLTKGLEDIAARLGNLMEMGLEAAWLDGVRTGGLVTAIGLVAAYLLVKAWREPK